VKSGAGGIRSRKGEQVQFSPAPALCSCNCHLPLNTSFFCCVDFRNLRCVTEQITFDVVEEEVLCVRIGEIEAVVIDDLCLFLEPVAPTRLADFRCDSLSQGIWKRCKADPRTLLAAVRAFDVVSHVEFLLVAQLGWQQSYHHPSA